MNAPNDKSIFAAEIATPSVSFVELGLSEAVCRAINDAGYVKPTPIQLKAIPQILQGRDLLACAQTGTGKTASFTLPMIDILASGRSKARMPRSLILEPTRELAAQVAENFDLYGRYSNLSQALLIGGESFIDQERKLNRGVDVLIATPGRLLDLFERGKILLSDVKLLVIDEADRMLDMGFIPDIEQIVSFLPVIRQTLLLSATMPSEIQHLTQKFLLNPREVRIAASASTVDGVVQQLVWVTPDNKREALYSLLRAESMRNALIFCNRKRDIGILQRTLERNGFPACSLHGDLAQSIRISTLEDFRNGKNSIMICSDVAARGIDIDQLSHVFNFDVPRKSEDYVHRIGRTGRAGHIGHAITLATEEEQKYITAIEKLICKPIPTLQLTETNLIAAKTTKTDIIASESAPAPKNLSSSNKVSKIPQKTKVILPSHTVKNQYKTKQSDPIIIGFGDHTPKFLLQPAPVN